MNINELKAAREWNEGHIEYCERHIADDDINENYKNNCRNDLEYHKIMKTLLDNAINAPDLESLKKPQTMELSEPQYRYNEAFNDGLKAAIDHLAPRIVREGFVVVPEEPTYEMCAAVIEDPRTHRQTAIYYKAMIAASKGD